MCLVCARALRICACRALCFPLAAPAPLKHECVKLCVALTPHTHVERIASSRRLLARDFLLISLHRYVYCPCFSITVCLECEGFAFCHARRAKVGAKRPRAYFTFVAVVLGAHRFRITSIPHAISFTVPPTACPGLFWLWPVPLARTLAAHSASKTPLLHIEEHPKWSASAQRVFGPRPPFQGALCSAR